MSKSNTGPLVLRGTTSTAKGAAPKPCLGVKGRLGNDERGCDAHPPDLGFNDPSHFSGTFKKVFGLSPAAFRRLPSTNPKRDTAENRTVSSEAYRLKVCRGIAGGADAGWGPRTPIDVPQSNVMKIRHS